MIIIILLIAVLIPVFAGIGVYANKRRAQQQARRLKAYRTSPESHILNLRD